MDFLESLELNDDGREVTTLSASIVRPLTEEDLPQVLASPVKETPKQRLHRITNSHHKLAQLLSIGSMSDTQISAITGYSLSYISIMKGDPAFQELMAYYAENQEAILVDTMERMRTLGLMSLEELQARLIEEPDAWTKKELMDLAEMMLIKPQMAKAIAAAGGPARARVEFTFVKPSSDGPTIDGEVTVLETQE